MLQNILNLFSSSSTLQPLAPDDARIAIAALLVRVAKADHDYATSEKESILEILMERYQIDRDKALDLRSEAETVEAQAPDTVRFTRLIKEAVPFDDRRAVVVALWQVVLADDIRDAHEDSVLRLVVGLLGVSDRDSGLARQKARQILDAKSAK